MSFTIGGDRGLFVQPVADDISCYRLAIQIEPQTGNFARTIVAHGDVLPATLIDGGSRPDANAIAGPHAVKPRFQDAVLEHQIETVVTHIGAESALQHDDGFGVAGIVANPAV